MEEKKLKCSNVFHKENEVISFCYNCKIYMCHKCEKLHSDLFLNHKKIKIEKEKKIEEIFTGLCEEENHPYELKYFCKTHNKLCCGECITKIKGKYNGQHTDCDVCFIDDIKNEKIQKLNENIKILEELNINLKESINKIKLIFQKNEKKKEEIKIEIQKVFTNLRNAINNREDELLLKLDQYFEELFLNENIIKQSEKLPNKIKISLEKGRLINNKFNNKELNSIINDCIKIENNINDVNKINQSMKKYESSQNNINFFIDEIDIQKLYKFIKSFGYINQYPFSEIIKEEDFIKLNEWIGKPNNYILKYSAKKDGCNTEIFHKNCDGICGSVFICKAENGDIIGGYMTAKIQKNNEFIDDEKAFLFNLTQNIVKRNKNSYKNAIQNCNDSTFFIRFGDKCKVFYISGNCLNSNDSHVHYCTCKENTNFDTQVTNIFNHHADEDFKVENFEVFQVI